MRKVLGHIDYKVLFIIALIKAILIIWIMGGYLFLPFNESEFRENFIAKPEKETELSTSFQTWDAQHYIFLADNGYQKELHPSNAFYPALPIIIILFKWIGNNSFIWGVLISNIVSCIAFYVFYRFVNVFFNKRVAWMSLLFFLTFPTSFYFSLIYTEGLFLLLAVAFFYYLFKHHYVLASICALLLPITRPTGFLIVVPFAFFILYEIYKSNGKPITKYIDPKLLYVLSPIIGFLMYLSILQLWAGTFKAGIRAQVLYTAQHKLTTILNPFEWPSWIYHNFINVHWTLHNYHGESIFDRLFFFFFLGLSWLMRKIKYQSLLVYSLTVGIVQALSDSFISYPRYLVIIFPLFIVLGEHVRNKTLRIVILSVFFITQLILLSLHSLGYWVA